MSSRLLRRSAPAWLAALLCIPSIAAAQTATSVDAKVQAPEIKPSERGSVAGQLANVAFGPADVSRGGFALPSPFAAPSERGPLQAEVFPSFAPDHPLSEWGVGWNIALAMTRFRILGDIDYQTDELTGPFGRLVQGKDGNWYPIGLSKPIRVTWSGDTIVAFLPDGTRMVFGGPGHLLTVNYQGASATYAWYLASVDSPTGQRTQLDYQANASGRLFLTSAWYGGHGGDFQHRVDFEYEALAIPFKSFAARALVTLDRRVSRVVALSKKAGAFVERWHYDPRYREDGLGPAFYLSSVQQVFGGGDKPPPTNYDYRMPKEALSASAFVANRKLTPLLTTLQADVIQPDKGALVDLDQDGLIDVERAYDFQLARQTEAGWSFEPLPPAPGAYAACKPGTFTGNKPRALASLRANESATHVLSLLFDLSSMTTTFTACDRSGVKLGTQQLANNWELSGTTRVADLNRDRQPDLIRIFAGGYQARANTSTDKTVSFGLTKAGSLSPSVTPQGAWVQDFNGDGIPDIVVRSSSAIHVWYGKGNFEFQPVAQSFAFYSINGALALTNYSPTFVDANKDGLIDVLLTSSVGNATFLFVNRGTEFRQASVPGLVAVDSSASKPVIADFSGSGNTEIAYMKYGQGYVVALDAPGTGLLSRADDGKGTVLRFDYERARPAAGLRQRHAVLAKLTVDSSGYDSVAYSYSYQGPRLHSIGKFLLGFDKVTRADLNLTESINFLNEDRYAGVLLSRFQHDAKASVADAFEERKYDEPPNEAALAGVPFKRLRSVTKGFRDASGSAVSETAETTAYALDICPATVQTTLSSGVLTVTKDYYAQLPAFPNALACLARNVVEQGTHPDGSLDFGHETEITRNSLGQVTRVESVDGAKRWVLQDVTYDALNRVETVGAPGRGTAVVAYDDTSGTGLLQEIRRPDGVIATVVARDPLLDQSMTLRTTRGPASYQQFFQYDGLERLQSRRDDLGGASKDNPNESYAYRYAAASTPASVYVSTLVDAINGSARERIEFATAAGESVGTASRVPEGWAFGRLLSRSRSRGEASGSLRGGLSSSADPLALDYASLFPAGAPAIDFTSTSVLGGEVDRRTTFHDGVERRLTGTQAIDAGMLVLTSTENGTYSTSSRADASKRVLRFEDEAGVAYTYVYDALGRVRQVLLPDGRRHTVRYDPHGRPTEVVREGLAKIGIGYDSTSGLPTVKHLSSPAGELQQSVSWTYDAIGRVLEELHADASGTKTYSSYWDGATPTAPAANSSPGLLTAVTGDGYVKLLEYRVDGALTKRTVSLAGWRSIETSFGYLSSGDIGSRATRVLDGNGTELSRSDWGYRFDTNGRPWLVTLNGAELVRYSNDPNDLLTRATFASGDVVTLTYDGTTRRLTGSTQFSAAGAVATTQRTGTRGLPESETIQVGSVNLSRQYEYWPQRFLWRSTDEKISTSTPSSRLACLSRSAETERAPASSRAGRPSARARSSASSTRWVERWCAATSRSSTDPTARSPRRGAARAPGRLSTTRLGSAG